MKKLYILFMVLLMNFSYVNAFTWEDCIEKYEKAKQFSDNTRLAYTYLQSTKNCLIKFKNFLVHNPDPEFTVKAMNDNIVMLDKNMDKLIPKYIHPKNSLEHIPKYIHSETTKPKLNYPYNYIKKFKACNGVHAQDKIYTAKHCNIKQSKNIDYDLNFIKAKSFSKLKVSNIDLDKKGVFKYYSMSKVGMYYNALLQEKNCQFYKVSTKPIAQNKTLDLTDLTKKEEIRSNCLAIPSNSGGGVFQDGQLVGIISKTVFNNNTFMYSVIEPILSIYEKTTANNDY